MKIHSGHATNTVAEFGSTTFIGLQATEHVKITNSSFEIKDGGTMAAKHPVRSTCAREAGNSAAKPIGHGRGFIACHTTLFKIQTRPQSS